MIPAVIGGLLIGLAACGTDGTTTTGQATTTRGPTTSSTTERGPLPQPVQSFDIDAKEYAFTFSPDPAEGLKPGWTLIRFHNVGKEAHQVMFAKIKPGVDLSTLAAAGAGDSSGAGAIKYVDMIGGVSYTGPGGETTALVKLEPGLVMAMCYVPDAKGVAHALMGMSRALTVSDTSASVGRTGDTRVRGTIEFGSGGYRLPRRLTPGWYHVRNTDTALHELSLLRLGRAVDATEVDGLVSDLAANKTPSVKVQAMGGMGAVSGGFDGYLYLDLPPGHYLGVDFMPDPGDPRPHLLDGYHVTFTV